MPTLYDSQFDLDAALIFVYSSIKEAPYGIRIKFNTYQQNRIIELLTPFGSEPKKFRDKNEKGFFFFFFTVEMGEKMNARVYSGRDDYNKVMLMQEESHILHDTIMKKVKNSEPLTCKQFQRLCRVVRLGINDNPTPNEVGIVHLLAEAGKELFDLKEMDENEIEAWASGHAKILLKMIQS